MDKFIVHSYQKGLTPWLRKMFHAEEDKSTLITTSHVIIFGGSMTLGQQSLGCCCRNDTKCGAVKDRCEAADNFTVDDTFLSMDGFCSWGGYLGRWLKHVAPPSVNISYHQLAKGGVHSGSMAAIAEGLLVEEGITHLTSSDIVFLDESVNDYESNAAEDVEMLVRVLYGLSKESFPAIVLLEITAGVHKRYEAVSKHYQIPLWDWSTLLQGRIGKEVVGQGAGFLREDFERSPEHRRNNVFIVPEGKEFGDWMHLPWPLHLLYSDAIGKTLLMEAGNLKIEGEGEGLLLRWEEGNVVLPPPLNHKFNDTGVHCTPKNTLFHLNAEIMIKHHAVGSDAGSNQDSRLVNFEATRTVMSSSWKLTSDRPHKFGWISAWDDTESGASAKGGKEEQILSFSLHNNNNKNNNNSSSSNTHSVVPYANDAVYTSKKTFSKCDIHLILLRSYENVGIVRVRWCGMDLGIVDTMWAASLRATHHFSISEREKFSYTNPSNAACQLEIIHIPSYGEYIHQARLKTEKVKIQDVHVCCEL